MGLLTRMECFVNLVNMNDSSSSDRTISIQRPVLHQPLVFLLQPPKAAPVVPPAPASRGRLCYRGGLTAPILLPPLARPSLHSPTPPVILRRRQPQTAAEPANPRTPIHVGIHCRIFPGSASSPSLASPSSTTLVLSARRGQCGQ